MQRIMKRFPRSQTLLRVGKGFLCDFLSRFSHFEVGNVKILVCKAFSKRVDVKNCEKETGKASSIFFQGGF